MQTVSYGDGVSVDFTDDEYRRLQEIKRRHYEDPNWMPPEKIALASANDKAVNLYMSAQLKDRIARYAAETGRSVSEVMRNAMEVLTA